MKYFILILFCVLSVGQANALEQNKNIPYVEGSDLYRQKLDIYTPYLIQQQHPKVGLEHMESDLKGYPVFIFVHGGGWSGGDKKNLKPKMAEAFTRQDVVVVSINYRLAPKNPFPYGMEDLASAVKWVHDHISEYRGDPNNITLSGHSAGAHMVALLGLDASYLSAHDLNPNMFNAIIPVDTASFDLTTKKTGKAARLVNFMILRAFGEDQKVLKKASPLHIVENVKQDELSKFRFYVTGARPDAVIENQLLMDALLTKGGDADLIVMDESLSHADMKVAIFDPFSKLHKDIISTFDE